MPSNINRTPIIVAGWPKSGNSFTCWLLGDMLDSPVERWGAAMPLSMEGHNRPGRFIIHQLHLQVVNNSDYQTAIVDANKFCPLRYKDEKIVLVLRDPRDIVVSAKHYWEIDSIAQTIRNVARGETPFMNNGGYENFITGWLACHVPYATLRYEDLITTPLTALKHVLSDLNIDGVTDERISEAIERQSIENKRKEITIDGDGRPYGKGIQLHNLRKGIVGDWRNEFTKADGRLMHEYLGALMARLGYEKDINWWEELRD